MILIHKTWTDLKPNEDNNGNYEWFEEYYHRIKEKFEYKNLPKDVLEQWIYPLYDNYETLKNYSWLNFRNIVFEPIDWELNQLERLYVIKDFREHVALRASYTNFDQFCCRDIDMDFWLKNGTWRIPPIVLDTASLDSEIPKWSEISKEYQLVEGHSRLGYLKSIQNINKFDNVVLAKKHRIYLMKFDK